jgi:hypothetical protein
MARPKEAGQIVGGTVRAVKGEGRTLLFDRAAGASIPCIGTPRRGGIPARRQRGLSDGRLGENAAVTIFFRRFFSQVAASVSEWKRNHSLTLAATSQPIQIQPQAWGQLRSESP